MCCWGCRLRERTKTADSVALNTSLLQTETKGCTGLLHKAVTALKVVLCEHMGWRRANCQFTWDLWTGHRAAEQDVSHLLNQMQSLRMCSHACPAQCHFTLQYLCGRFSLYFKKCLFLVNLENLCFYCKGSYRVISSDLVLLTLS